MIPFRNTWPYETVRNDVYVSECPYCSAENVLIPLRKQELHFIHEFAKLEGIILDPVYTGKAMYGLVEEIKKGTFKNCENILFIHTGGAFGLFPEKHLFEF